MGRRALRKIPPEIDISRHLLQGEALTGVLDIAGCFGHVAPLEIEVGSGKGLFLTSASAARPERDFLGIEIAGKYARFIAARLAREQRSNARIIHGNAERLFRDQLPESIAAAVHIYFPDPWWKKRHHKRRIMNARFLRDVHRVLQPSGELHFWTDVAEYYQISIDLIVKQLPFHGPLPVPEQSPVHEMDYRTHFERRTRLEGLPVYRAVFRKPAGDR